MGIVSRIHACGLAALFACASAFPAAVQAKPSTGSPSELTREVRPGARVTFTTRVDGARTCTMRVGGAHGTAKVSGATRVSFSFRVAPWAETGTSRVSVSCPPARTQHGTLRVRRTRPAGRTSRALVSGPLRIAVAERSRPNTPRPPPAVARDPNPAAGGAVTPATLSEADALARARADWNAYGAGYLAVFRNGQCTDWAAQKRPDIVEQATVRLWADHLMGLPDLGISWNGGSWDDMARAARMAVGTVPRAGAVVTFDPGVLGTSAATGHIAYVETVDDGTFTVSEMNAPLPWQVTYRTIPTAAVALGGISFVY
jgi:surface antigen